MGYPTLFVGTANPDSDAEMAQACDTMSIAEVAAKFKKRESAIKAAIKRHASTRRFDLWLTGPAAGGRRIRVAHVVSTAPFTNSAIAAYRAYPATLKKLDLPGWNLVDDEGTQCVAVVDLQRGLARQSKHDDPDRALARLASRIRLGLD